MLNFKHKYPYMNEAGAEGGAGGAAVATAETAATTVSAANAEIPAAEKQPEAIPSLLGDKDKPTDKPAEAAGQKTEEKVDVKPIEYTDFKLPDGMNVDAAKLTEFKTLAAELGLPQEGAQKMLDIYTNQIKAVADGPMNAWRDLQTTWRNEVINDPVIGGQNLDRNLAATKSGLNALLGDQAGKFFDALNVTGAGNNPDIVRALFTVAKAHAPATPVNGGPGSSAPRSAGATLYPSQAGLGNGHTG